LNDAVRKKRDSSSRVDRYSIVSSRVVVSPGVLSGGFDVSWTLRVTAQPNSSIVPSPRCHFPTWAVSYPASRKGRATLGRPGSRGPGPQFGSVDVPVRCGYRPVTIDDRAGEHCGCVL
jgi:hypothetical protein